MDIHFRHQHSSHRHSPRFQGASPGLTSGYYIQLLPNRNASVAMQVAGLLPADLLILSRGQRYQHLFSQDTQWVFKEGTNPGFKVRHRTDEEVPDFLPGKARFTPLVSNLSGGNCYIGVMPSGKPYCLVGERIINTSGDTPGEGLRQVARDLGIKDTRTVTVIPQMPEWYQYDIDVFIRPLNGRDILVYDPETAREFLKENRIERVTAVEGADPGSRYSFRSIQRLLEDRGFNVIKAPGLFRYEGRLSTGQPVAFNISLLNSLVSENPQKRTLDFLTMDPAKTDLKNAFAGWLREHCPDIGQVAYIDGGAPRPGMPLPNRMVQIFNEERGGLHCLFGEIIDGLRWFAANR